MKKEKKEVNIVRSSAAEYLTFVAPRETTGTALKYAMKTKTSG